ncbi:MAG: hypothetical protein OXN25_11900 [Candidatus Poribacteria bacterium]|nr:hypothetical protein [Candidatus Poribacteria bacterium]
MVLLKLLPFFGVPLGAAIAWLLVRHPNPETRRKRGQILLVLAPIVFPVLLFLVFLISR